MNMEGILMVKRLFLIFLICIFCFVNFDESKHTYKNNIQIDFNSSTSSIEYSLDRNYEGLQSYSHNYTKVDVSFIGSLDDYDGLLITGGPVGFNNCTLSSTLLQFDNQNSCKLTIDFRPLIEGDFSIELIVMYYKITDGHIVTNNIETPQYLNLYIFKDSQHYYMSLISASKAREYSYNFLFEKGCLDLDDFDDYVYGNSLLSEQLVVPISEDFNLMSGYVHLNINNKLYGAEGIEIGVLIIYNDGSDAYFSANVDENGFYEFPFYVNSNFYSVTFLCSSRTNYVKIVSNNPSISSNSNNSLYSFSYDLTNTISSNVKYHYLMDSIEIGNTSDRDKAFILAVQFNPAGKFVEQVMKYNLMKEDCITCYYPSNNINSFNRNLKYISLSTLNVSICYHEFGHYIFNKIGIDPENYAGGAHNSYFDLAIKYSDGYGYKLAWNEGIATFFASCVQVAYNNYSWISESWLEEYNIFKNYLS